MKGKDKDKDKDEDKGTSAGAMPGYEEYLNGMFINGQIDLQAFGDEREKVGLPRNPTKNTK